MSDVPTPANEAAQIYLRLTFLTYWADASPSVDVFYSAASAFAMTPAEIARFEQAADAYLGGQIGASGRMIHSTLAGFNWVEMTDADVASVSDRVLGVMPGSTT